MEVNDIEKRNKTIVKWVKRFLKGWTLCWVLYFVSIPLFFMLNTSYEGFGTEVRLCVSGSMEPTIMTNSLIVIDRNVKFKDLKTMYKEVGSKENLIVVFSSTQEDRLINHRIYRMRDTGKIQYVNYEDYTLVEKIIRYDTKGDNSINIDDESVGEENFYGVVTKTANIYSPFFNLIIGDARNPNALRTIIGVLILAFIIGSPRMIYNKLKIEEDLGGF